MENPAELVSPIEHFEQNFFQVGKNLAFKVKILAAVGLPRRVVQSSCKYKFFGQKDVESPTINGQNPAYAFEQLFTYRPVTREVFSVSFVSQTLLPGGRLPTTF